LPRPAGWAPGYVSVKGNPAAARQAATLFDNPVDWAALLRRYRHGAIHSAGGDPVLSVAGSDTALMPLTDLRVPQRPVLVVDDPDASLVSAVPHARLLGALVVPLDEAAGVLAALEPAEVYATDAARHRLPVGAWRVLPLPGTPADLAYDFQQRVRRRHSDRLSSLDETHPHLLASRALLAEMSPAEYVVLSALDPAAPLRVPRRELRRGPPGAAVPNAGDR
jgi:hypothetical protein